MSITEILEAHVQNDVVAKSTQFYCLCGWVSEEPRYGEGRAEHRAHVAEVIEQYVLEREAQAWELGAATAWQRSSPTVNGTNYYWRSAGEPASPYRKESSDGR